MKRAVALLALCLLSASAALAMGSAPERESKPAPAPAKPEGFSITLPDAFRSALQSDEIVAIRREELERTFGDTMEAAGEVIGDVDYVYTDMRQDAPNDSFSGSDSSVASTSTSRTRSEGKWVLKQPVFQGFKEFGAIGGAGALRAERVQEKARAEELLFLDVAAAFYGVLEARKDLGVLDDIRKLYDERIHDLGVREEIGRSRSSEISSARARMRTLEADYAEARGELAVAEAQFEYLTGIVAKKNELDDSSLPSEIDAPVDWTPIADARADVRAARAAMEVARNAIIVYQSEFFPTVDLTVNWYEKREGFQEDIDWDVLFTVDAPIFKGGTTVGRMQKAVSDYRIARLAYERARRDAMLELERTRELWIASLDRTRAFEAALESAQENFEFQKEEYTRSLVSNLDVLEALQTLLETRRSANEAFYLMKQNYWRHRVARGEMPS